MPLSVGYERSIVYCSKRSHAAFKTSLALMSEISRCVVWNEANDAEGCLVVLSIIAELVMHA